MPAGQGALERTRRHYAELRNVVYQFTENEFASYAIKLSEIEYKDAVEGDTWKTMWSESGKIPIWSWVRMYNEYRSNAGIKRFDVAVRTQGKLCALCYGVPNKSKLVLKLHALSRLPIDNPLEGKILRVVLFSADAYARLIGSDEIWLMNPMNTDLVGLYEKAGFSAHANHTGQVTHLSMRIS